jgi:hypothetical protein
LKKQKPKEDWHRYNKNNYVCRTTVARVVTVVLIKYLIVCGNNPGGIKKVRHLWRTISDCLSLQAAVGGFHLETLAYPINLLAAVVFFLLLLLLHFFRRKFAALRWLSSYQAAISSISSLALLTLVMGLVKQLPGYMHEGDAWPGFAQMLSNWAFAFLFVWFIAVLGMTVFLRLFSAQWKDIPFVLNHLGLLIALTGAVLGSADIQQLEMNTLVGRPQWMATNERGDVLELPLAIELHGFP